MAMAYRRNQGPSRSATFVDDHRGLQFPDAGADGDADLSPSAAQAICSSSSSSQLRAQSPRASTYSSQHAALSSSLSFSDDRQRDAQVDQWPLKHGVLLRKMPDVNGPASPRTISPRWSQGRRPESPRTTPKKGPAELHMAKRPLNAVVVAAGVAKQEDAVLSPRDVAKATAAKAKELLQELTAMKADLAFANGRCSELEEENKKLRGSPQKGRGQGDEDEEDGHRNESSHEEDDMISGQLETLLAEKAKLAHENSICSRENRFLWEIVEYHQLNMPDINDDDDDNIVMVPPRLLAPEDDVPAAAQTGLRWPIADTGKPSAPPGNNRPASPSSLNSSEVDIRNDKGDGSSAIVDGGSSS